MYNTHLQRRFSGRLKRLCFFIEWFVIPKCYYYFFYYYHFIHTTYIHLYIQRYFLIQGKESELLGQFLDLFYGFACRRVRFACKYTTTERKRKKKKKNSWVPLCICIIQILFLPYIYFIYNYNYMNTSTDLSGSVCLTTFIGIYLLYLYIHIQTHNLKRY